jgi:GxxExxY protein
LGRRGAEALSLNEITEAVIGAAIEVHKVLGPGLLESAYEECLCHELALRGLAFRRQVSVPVRYKSVALDCGYVLDLIIEDQVIVELKSVDSLQSVHAAQLLTYLRLLDKRLGLLINFRAARLVEGIKRVANNL